MYRNYVKRLLDIVCSILGLIFCLPLLLVITILVRIKLGTPIFFKQVRASKGNLVFTMYKFRTMTRECDQNGNLLPTEMRLTKFGSFLRSISLDELPELFNILKGDISIVGPRPLIPEYISLYTPYELQRFEVRGGLIPPELLYGNIVPTWEQQFEYEVFYAKNVTFFMDCKIVFATLKGIIKRTSINYGTYIRGPISEERKNKINKDEKES